MSAVPSVTPARPIEFHPIARGVMRDLTRSQFPTVLQAWSEDGLALSDTGTHFGYVVDGHAIVHSDAGEFRVPEGFFFAIPGKGTISGGSGMAVTRVGNRGMFMLGGPVEPVGRLRYIDGCSDSLLLSPIKRGDPCLNFLHLPPGTRQTMHTHPSVRVGVVISGAGRCIWPGGEEPLLPGRIFVILDDQEHCFFTDDDPLRIVVYHPDSDFGPTDEEHPMINRTLVDNTPILERRR